MRLIDADSLKEIIKAVFSGCNEYDVDESEAIYDFNGIVDRTPTVETVKRGHWEWFEEWSKSNTEHYAECDDCGWRCSLCKETLETMVGGYYDDADDKPKLKYCPNCGAKMEGVKDGKEEEA